MEELELLNIPGFNSVGVVLKINSTTAKLIRSVTLQNNRYSTDSFQKAPNWVQEANKELKKAEKIEQLYNKLIITTTEKKKINIELGYDKNNYIWLFDDD